MTPNECAVILDSLVFRPGWKFSAKTTPNNDWWGGDVELHMECTTVDTDREYARQGYNMPRTLEWDVPLDSRNYDNSDQLLGAVFVMLMQIELHEAREFLRVGSENFRAPFHPHRPEGDAAYQRQIMGEDIRVRA
jgi:hypothetical protein